MACDRVIARDEDGERYVSRLLRVSLSYHSLIPQRKELDAKFKSKKLVNAANKKYKLFTGDRKDVENNFDVSEIFGDEVPHAILHGLLRNLLYHLFPCRRKWMTVTAVKY